MPPPSRLHPNAAQPRSVGRRDWLRLCLLRGLAVLIGLSLLGLGEAACRLAGWGAETDRDDPYVSFSGLQPLFAPSADGKRFEIPRSRGRWFGEESFPITKPSGTRRIVVVGESTVAGEPYGSPTSFAKWLELGLNASEPGRPVDVINCGGISYASYRLAPIVEECLNYEPDLMILAIGHNEFLEDRTYASIRETAPAIRWLHKQLSPLYSYRALRGLVYPHENAASRTPATLPPDVAARLDFQNGLDQYHRNDAWRRGIVEHYRFNLARMVRRVRSAGVPLLLIRQPTNLADCPPFKSEHLAGLSAQGLAEFDRLIEAARAAEKANLAAAVDLFTQALAIDPDHALTHYELGQCHLRQGDSVAARCEFVIARDRDICPLRMVSELDEVLAKVARDTQTPLVDAHELFESRTPGGVLGGFWLVDHVHPSIAGHQLLAGHIEEVLVSRGWISPAPDAPARRKAAFETHTRSLGDLYYLKGEQTLRRLRKWTRGDVQPQAARVR